MLFLSFNPQSQYPYKRELPPWCSVLSYQFLASRGIAQLGVRQIFLARTRQLVIVNEKVPGVSVRRKEHNAAFVCLSHGASEILSSSNTRPRDWEVFEISSNHALWRSHFAFFFFWPPHSYSGAGFCYADFRDARSCLHAYVHCTLTLPSRLHTLYTDTTFTPTYTDTTLYGLMTYI